MPSRPANQTPSPFLEALAKGWLLADGAMGTLLYARGVSYDKCFDALSETRPELVAAIHEAYVAAGARVIETNSFGANALRLAEHGLADRARALAAASARIARQVADAHAGPERVWVAGSVGPLGVSLAPIGPVPVHQARGAFVDQIRGLAEGGADLIIIETMRHLTEALVALEAAHEVCDLPVVVQLTFGEDGFTAAGRSPEEIARALDSIGADVIGANCSTGPAMMLDVVARMAAATSRPVSAMPNAGLPNVVAGRYVYASSPAYMADLVGQMVDAGVRLVGGCCGTTPEHITEMAASLKGRAVGRPAALRDDEAFPSTEPARLASPYDREVPAYGVTRAAASDLRTPVHRPTNMQLALASGRPFITVEVVPPRGFSVATLLPKLRMLKECGAVDALNVADSPRAQACMSALALGTLIQSELGLETILHMGVRHRNMLATHSELLGAHALGIRNVFVVMGDLPATGDYPDATVNKDLTATGLMRLLSQFNEGHDQHGRELEAPTAFHIGCAFNPAAPDLAKELTLLDRKMESGAQFALTQPVYDPRVLERAIAQAGGRLPLPIIVGVLPLWNARHANFLHNEVPGIVIPERVLERMNRAGDGDGVRREGVQIACDVLAAIGAAASGAYFMPPFEKYELVPEILSRVDLRGAEVSR